MSDQIPTDSADKARPKSIGRHRRQLGARRARTHRACGNQRTARRAPLEDLFPLRVPRRSWLIAVWGVFDFTGDKVAKTGRHTALVELEGEIAANSDASADNVNAALDSAFEDDGTAA